MRLWIKILLLGVLSVSFANAERSFRIQEMQNEARVALVIGNGAYDGGKLNKLKNPTNDSYDIKELLKRKGFEVIYVEDASQEEMDSSVNTFLNKLKSKKAIGMFYYAGHGVEVKGENYLIPIGANIPDENSIKYRTLAVNRVVDGMKDAKNRLNIIILDACRNNPYKNTRGANGGLAEISNADGIFIAYATDKGKTAEDGRGRNGLFTTHLLKYMDTEGLTIEQMFKSVRKAVREESDGFQIPWQSSSIEGDFYFTLPKVQNTQVVTQSVQGVKKIEQVVKPVKQITKPIVQEQKVDKEVENQEVENQEVVKQVEKPIVVQSKAWNPLIYRGKRSYSVNSSNTVKDNYTGLIWQKSGSDFYHKINFEDSKIYCQDLSLDGYNDWRLPSIEELVYLCDVTKENPAIDTRYFKVKGDYYWGITKNSYSSSSTLYLFTGEVSSYHQAPDKNYALCVCEE